MATSKMRKIGKGEQLTLFSVKARKTNSLLNYRRFTKSFLKNNDLINPLNIYLKY